MIRRGRRRNSTSDFGLQAVSLHLEIGERYSGGPIESNLPGDIQTRAFHDTNSTDRELGFLLVDSMPPLSLARIMQEP